MKKYYFDNFFLCIEKTWSDNNHLGVVGWALGRFKPIDKLILRIDGVDLEIVNFMPRQDLLDIPTGYYFHVNCGFIFVVNRKSIDFPVFVAQIDGGAYTECVGVTGEEYKNNDYSFGGHLFQKFRDSCNQNRSRVLEIGSRIVSPGSQSKRNLFSDAGSYKGFDFYLDDNTDVEGDAHKLSTYFPDEKFDAVFSISVYEHLAMPWVVSLEINKILELGGLTYHATHFSWPLHDEPWDFWRFTDNGLKNLFSAPMGFEVVDCGFWSPLRMHMEDYSAGQEKFPLAQHCFGGVGILARKVANFDSDKFKWDVDISNVLDAGSLYPKK